MMTRIPAIIGLAALMWAFAVFAASQHDDNWRKVLCFDVMATERCHKADLGDHTRVAAYWGPDNLGWEIEVMSYGDKSWENLLYDGNNWHGAQPWMVFAWTKHEKTYPDLRDVTYGKGRSQIRIVLVDCRTRQVGDNSFEFTGGRIEVFHRSVLKKADSHVSKTHGGKER